MHCILCLKKPNKSIALYGEHGLRLDIKGIINKHFWLEPNEDDINFNLICSPCWQSLQSFHKFYDEIEKTHRLFNKLSPETEYIFEGGGNSNDCLLNENDDIVYQGIKIEFNDESNTKPMDVDSFDENIKSPLELEVNDQNKSRADEVEQEESDSEIPLSKLSEQLQHKEESLESKSSSKTIDEVKITKVEKIHIHEGKWLATCFGEETVTKPISHDELDKFIKLNTELTCEICRIPMKDFSTLQTHFKNAHTIKPFVTCCDKKFELRCRLVDHILLHKLPNYFTCVVCSKVLSCRLNLRKHMVVHNKKEAFQCNQCEKTFYRKEVFNRHVLDIHTLDRKFKCEECDKLFASKCSLNTHIYGVHKGRYKKICEQCGKVSCDQETFLRHQMKHSNKPQTYFECPKCSVKLSTKHGLRHHIRYQHSEDTREHVCNVCGNISTTESALKRHVTFMHKYKRDFKCSLCEKAFKRAVTLKPNAELNNAKFICCSCWNTLETFHKFYETIEEAHTKLTTCLKLPDKESDQESTPFDTFSDLFRTVVKQENSEGTTKLELPETPEAAETIVTNTDEEKEILNSDNESEVPLVKLNNRRSSLKDDNYEESKDNESDSEDASSTQNNDNQQPDFDSDSDSDYNAPKKKTKKKASANDLGKSRIPCKEFDSFIKKNMELSCSLCTKPLENFFSLKEHFKKVHKKDAFVTCCDRQWTSRFSLVHHLLLHQDPDLYKCKKCGRVLANKRSFKNHMQSHVTQERIHQCTKCKKKFSSIPKLEKHLKSHIRIHTDQICEQCGKVCHSKQSLSAHQKREHMGFVKQRVQCTKCGAYLSDSSTLHFHMKYQHPTTKVINVCNICGKISATAYGLKRHIQYMHTMERVHKCTICEDKAFKTAQILRPDMEDNNVICCSCWKTVESFHYFYKSIEEAHKRLTSLKHDNDESTHYETFSDLFTTVVKQENSDEKEFDLRKTTLIQPTNALVNNEKKILDSDSDSDSELPLIKLCTRKISMEGNIFEEDSANESKPDNASLGQVSDNRQCDTESDSDYKAPKKRAKVKDSSMANDFGKHQMPCKEFDSFIRKNMELVCNICTKPLENFVCLKEHFKKVHKTNGFVTCCDKQWTSRFSLVHHLLLHQNPDLFKCEKCGRVLANKKSFKNHMKSHVTKEPIHMCTKCKKLFSSISKLQRHLKTHFRADTDQICEQCGKVYHSKQILRAHQRREHLGFVKQRVQCTKCGVYLGDLSTLKFHTKHLHPKVKVVHACNICGKESATAYGLKRHIKYMHKMERVHKCSICEDKAFKTAQILRIV